MSSLDRPYGLTRRGLFRTVSAVALGSVAACRITGEPASLTSRQFPRVTGRSRVILVRDKGVIVSGGGVDAVVLRRMLQDAVVALTGAVTPEAAWRTLVNPGDTVGIIGFGH